MFTEYLMFTRSDVKNVDRNLDMTVSAFKESIKETVIRTQKVGKGTHQGFTSRATITGEKAFYPSLNMPRRSCVCILSDEKHTED